MGWPDQAWHAHLFLYLAQDFSCVEVRCSGECLQHRPPSLLVLQAVRTTGSFSWHQSITQASGLSFFQEISLVDEGEWRVILRKIAGNWPIWVPCCGDLVCIVQIDFQ